MGQDNRSRSVDLKRCIMITTILMLMGVLLFGVPAVVHQLNILKINGLRLGYFASSHITIVLSVALVCAVLSGRVGERLGNYPMGLASGDLLLGVGMSIGLLGAPVLLGLAGHIYRFGYDGLAVGLGWVGGLALYAIWLAPKLREAGGRSIPGYFRNRFNFAPLTWSGLALTTLFVCGLLAAIVAMLASTAQTIFEVNIWPVSLFVFLTLALFALVNPSTTAFRYAVIVCGAVAVAAYLATVIFAGIVEFGAVLPHLGYGSALETVAVHEHRALVAGVADPITFKAHARAEVHYNSLNFAVLTMCLMLGTAVAPHLISSASLFGLNDHGGANSANLGVAHRHTSAVLLWAIVCVATLIITAPVLATLAKLAVFRDLVNQAPSELPAWLVSLPFDVNIVEICGRAGNDLTLVAEACAALPDFPGTLRVDDINVSGPQVLPLVLAAARAPIWLWVLMGAGICAAFLATAMVLLQSLKQALRDCLLADETGNSLEPDDLAASSATADHRRKMRRIEALATVFVIVVVAAAALIAPYFEGKGNQLILGCFSVMAGSVLPVFALSLFAATLPAGAALCGLLVGGGLSLLYLLGTMFAPVVFFHLTSPLSDASAYAIEDYYELLSLWRSANPAKATDAWATLTTHTQPLANLWGLLPWTAGLFGMVSALVPMLVAVVFARRRPSA